MDDSNVASWVGAVASLLAGVAALVGLYITLTSDARLRRQEQTYREALQVLIGGDIQHRIVADLHKATIAQIVARKVTPRWRLTWPWLGWLLIGAMWTQGGYNLAKHAASGAGMNYFSVSGALFGDPAAAPTALLFIFLIGPYIYRSYFLALTTRAKIAARFMDGAAVSRPPALSALHLAGSDGYTGKSDILRAAARRNLERNVEPYWASVPPLMLVMSLGFLIGTQIWLRSQPIGLAEANDLLGGIPIAAVLLVTLTGGGTLELSISAIKRVRLIGPPSQYPIPRQLES